MPKPPRYALKNGSIEESDILLYTPRNTIPSAKYNRFLEMCDRMIIMLDPRTVNSAEVEEIAKFYRDELTIESIYEVINTTDGVLDGTMVEMLTKLQRSLEKRKDNLAITAKHRTKARDLSQQKTMMDLLAEMTESSKVEQLEAEHNSILEQVSRDETSGKYTNTKEYMEERLANSPVTTS